MLWCFGPRPCELVLLTEESDQEVAGTLMVIAWEARAVGRSGVAFKSNGLAAEGEGCLNTRKRLND